MRRFTFTLVSLLGITILSAQDCNKTLTGKVIDFHDGVPLENASITFNNKTIVTDSKGTYTINDLCAVSYAFTVSHINRKYLRITIYM